MFVVFDTNVWVSHRGLNSIAGKEVRDLIRNRGATLAVPEVVKDEVQRKLHDELRKRRDAIVESHRYLASLLGEREFDVPTDDMIEQCSSSLMESLGTEVQVIPLTIEAAQSSFKKILHKEQPSFEKREQFVDGVIWADCLDLLHTSDVWLVSEDKDFFRDRNYNHGIAPNLEKETKSRPNELKLFESLDSLLQHARSDATDGPEELVSVSAEIETE